MSHALISRSPDLERLADEGYAVDIVGGHLVVTDVPYVTSSQRIEYGTLASKLSLAGDKTVKPGTHVTFFAGAHPCHP